MGFFSDLKEDLSQAVNELMPEDGKNKADEPTDESGISLDEMLKNIDDIPFTEEMESEFTSPEETPAWQDGGEGIAVPEETPVWQDATEGIAVPEETPAWQDATEDIAVPEETPVWQDNAGGGASEADAVSREGSDIDGEMEQLLAEMMGENPEGSEEPEARQEEMQSETIIMEESKGEEEEMDMGDMELERDQVVSDETSVITEGMTITGDLSTQGSVDVIGTVNGNIDALGKLNITGHVNGNSKAAEIYAESAKINGEIVSEGAVKIGASSVIIGNISATSAAVAGAVKGDIDVKGPVILDASAIVMGNIKSKSVQINNGAVIEGMCSQCYADVSPTSFFEEYKPEPVRKPRTKQSDK